MSKAQERLDKVIVTCRQQMQEEVSALLGKAITFAQPETRLLTKEEFFSEPAGKSVLAHVKLDGDLEGEGCLIVPIRDAIRIGGTLIMLPDSELESVSSNEEYTEELEDSYGEIANIICGSLTSTFEEQYPKSFRLVRLEQEVILPVQVEIASDEPIPDGTYYVMTSAMALEGVEMGQLQLLLPAVSFGLVEAPLSPSPQEENVGQEEEATPATGELDPETVETEISEEISAEDAEPVEQGKRTEPPAEGEEPQTASTAPQSSKDIEKQKKRIDQLLKICLDKTGEEVGALLGGALSIKVEENTLQSKESFLEQAGGKQVMARLDVRGDGEGEAYLLVSLKDAIFLGGTLIMLPDTELEEVVRNEEFGEDAADAYGEIANIIAGVFTTVFEEQYRTKLGFVKVGLETIAPVKIDPDNDEVLPNIDYYLNSGECTFNGKELGRIQAVFPASLFELEGLAKSDDKEESTGGDATAGALRQDEESADSASMASKTSVATDQAPQSSDTVRQTEQPSTPSADILLFTDDETEGNSIARLLSEKGYVARVLTYREPVHNVLTSSISLVFLVMREVNEQGFGLAIKLTTGGLQVPLIVAAPAWTKTTVLKAVKYGAADILITPATAEDIGEKLDTNLAKKAA